MEEEEDFINPYFEEMGIYYNNDHNQILKMVNNVLKKSQHNFICAGGLSDEIKIEEFLIKCFSTTNETKRH